jgi:hypothetical protein
MPGGRGRKGYQEGHGEEHGVYQTDEKEEVVLRQPSPRPVQTHSHQKDLGTGAGNVRTLYCQKFSRQFADVLPDIR